MILTGIADEAGVSLETQIKATRELGWKHIEMRAVESAWLCLGNFHDIPGKALRLRPGGFKKPGWASIVLAPRSLIGPRNSPTLFKLHLTKSNAAFRACNESARNLSAS